MVKQRERDEDDGGASLDDTLQAFLGDADPEEICWFDWPGKPGRRAGVRCLTDTETRRCDFRARKLVTGEGAVPNDEHLRDDREYLYAMLAEVVATALVKPTGDDGHAKLCRGGAAELSGQARREVIARIAKIQAVHQRENAPTIQNGWTEEQLDVILDTLVKEPGATLYEQCERPMLEGLLRFTVARLRDALASKSSTSTPD